MTDSIYSDHLPVRRLDFTPVPVKKPATSADSPSSVSKDAVDQRFQSIPKRGRAMDDPKEKGAFSGRLLVRTTPEIHQDIYQAAKLSGRSINSWLEAVASKSAQEQIQAAQEIGKPLAPSARLLDDESDELAVLVDAVRPNLKSQKTASIFAFIAAVEAVQVGLNMLRQCLRDDRIDTASALLDAISPLLKGSETIVTPEFIEGVEIFFHGVDAVRKCIKHEDASNTQQVLNQILQFFSTVDSPP
jgi:uncharacterized protein (DUF1778 family)